MTVAFEANERIGRDSGIYTLTVVPTRGRSAKASGRFPSSQRVSSLTVASVQAAAAARSTSHGPAPEQRIGKTLMSPGSSDRAARNGWTHKWHFSAGSTSTYMRALRARWACVARGCFADCHRNDCDCCQTRSGRARRQDRALLVTCWRRYTGSRRGVAKSPAVAPTGPPITPMHPWRARAPFDRQGWVYERKEDGWRMLAEEPSEGLVRAAR